MGCLVSDLGHLSDTDSKDRLLGDFEWLHAHPQEIDGFVFGIGTPQVKIQLSEMLEADSDLLELLDTSSLEPGIQNLSSWEHE